MFNVRYKLQMLISTFGVLKARIFFILQKYVDFERYQNIKMTDMLVVYLEMFCAWPPE